MADIDDIRENPLGEVRDELEDVRAVMLGLADGEGRMVPMHPLLHDDDRRIFFFTPRDSDLGRTVGAAGEAMARMCLIGKDRDFHACLDGALAEEPAESLREALWSPAVSAWFDGGPEDRDAVLLAMTLTVGEIWASTGNPVEFGWEMLKANLTDSTPDIGAHLAVSFR